MTNRSSWLLVLITIGLIVIMNYPLSKKPINLIIGITLVAIGSLLLFKGKK